MVEVTPLANDAPPSVTPKTLLYEAAHSTQLEGLPALSLGLYKSQLLFLPHRPDTILYSRCRNS
jgi:hypothetical protein